MALQLVLRETLQVPLEVDGVLPEACAKRTLTEILRWPQWLGNRQVELGEFFTATGDAGDGTIVWQGDLTRVHRIGEGLAGGFLRIDGDAGRYVGQGMRAGRIDLYGHAGDWLGSGLRGGCIHVRGNAGDHAGGAAYGVAPGMCGGILLIDGSAGIGIGNAMRRGVLAVRGDTGELPALNLLAGTVVILGRCGARPGAGMRRGTIVIGSPDPPELLPTFRYSFTSHPLVLKLLYRELEALGFKLPRPIQEARYALHHGDFLEGGRGEVFLRAG